jgi:ATP-dependent DNA ligase
MPLARLPEPFDHNDWIFELKFDGWQAIEGRTRRLVSRNGNAFKRFPDIGAVSSAFG